MKKKENEDGHEEEEALIDLLKQSWMPDDYIVQIEQEVAVPEGLENVKLYNFIRPLIPTFSRRQLRAMFDRRKSILVNQEYMGSSDEFRRLRNGDIITVSITLREFISNTPEFLELKILYQNPSICAIEKLSNINCVKNSLFEYAYRLKCWDGRYYSSCDCFYRLPKHGAGIMIVARDEESLRQIFANFQLHCDTNYFQMACVTSSSQCSEASFEIKEKEDFDVIETLSVTTLQTIESKSYGFVSLQLIRPRLSLAVKDGIKTRELLSIDLKRIKHALQRQGLTVIGLDSVGKQGKGVFAAWNTVSFSPLSEEEEDPRVLLESELPGKFLKFLQKEDHYMLLQDQKKQRTSRGEVQQTNNHQSKRKELQRPVEYESGLALFWGLSFLVSQEVLIPRPASEQVVYAALDCLSAVMSSSSDRSRVIRVLDLGTGSGNLLLSLLHQATRDHPDHCFHGYGLDISETALDIAERNARNLKLEAMVEFGLGSFEDPETWFSSEADSRYYDLILCNPPYSSQQEKRRLSLASRQYEPALALFADPVDPLRAYRSLQQSLALVPISCRFFVTEIGAGQLPSVLAIFSQLLEGEGEGEESGSWKLRETRKDLQGHPRALTLERR